MPKPNDLSDQLEAAVGDNEMDEVIYRLVAIAVKRRDEADKGTNRGEQRHCQRVVEILNDCQRQLEGLN